MPNGAVGAAGATAIAAMANAVKASGAIVQVEPQDFQNILMKAEKPLVVYAKGNLFTGKYQYLLSYKGFIFFTKSSNELILSGAEIIHARRIWLPG